MTEQEAKRAFAFIFCTRLIDSIGFGIIMPVLPTLLMEVGKMPLAEAARTGGVLFVTYALLQFLSGPLMGSLSDRFGRRPVIFVSLAAFAIDYAFMALAPSIAFLFLGRAIAGVAGAVFAPANAFVADITPPERRARAFGRLGAAFGVGFIVGPALGGLVSDFGPRAPFLLAAVLAAVNLVFGFFVLPESLPPERRRPISWVRSNPIGGLMALGHYKGVLGIILAFFIFQLAFNVYPGTWSYYAEAKFGWDGKMIGLSLMCSGVFMFLIQFLGTGWIASRLGDVNTAMTAMAISIAGCIAYAFIPYGWMVFFIQPLVSPQALVFPTQNAILSKRVAANEQGALQGTMGSMISLGSVFGPLLLTQTLARFTEPGAPIYFPGAAFLLAAVLMSVGLATLAVATQRQRRPVPAE
ncbi:MAG: TCR/Tet family MFS transporter [Alphaproteobacteria bacterium]|nr:TCR/Tet family MFS transporter [Alphaproteobacteria bacterium]